MITGCESLRNCSKSVLLGGNVNAIASKKSLMTEREVRHYFDFLNSNVRPLDHPLKGIQKIVEKRYRQSQDQREVSLSALTLN